MNPRVLRFRNRFRSDGPASATAGLRFLVQGMCGIMDLTAEPDGEPEKVGVTWIDVFTGYGVIGIQTALAEREPSGLGQHVDLALLDVGAAVLANQAMNDLARGGVPRRMGNAHPDIVPYQVFPDSDGHLIITCGNDRHFASLCDMLGLDGVSNGPASKSAGLDGRPARAFTTIAAKFPFRAAEQEECL
ncbi:hypothetical protein CO676_33910 [Sinorhizobium sp. BJ1]|nr:hypothetical protein CO676_33910 [Sinorhizobium sp. BJ1]